MKSIGVENVPLKDDGNIDHGKLDFHKKMALVRHIAKRKVNCDICKKVCKNIKSFTRHKNSMHGFAKKKIRKTSVDSEKIACQNGNNSILENNSTENENKLLHQYPRV